MTIYLYIKYISRIYCITYEKIHKYTPDNYLINMFIFSKQKNEGIEWKINK